MDHGQIKRVGSLSQYHEVSEDDIEDIPSKIGNCLCTLLCPSYYEDITVEGLDYSTLELPKNNSTIFI